MCFCLRRPVVQLLSVPGIDEDAAGCAADSDGAPLWHFRAYGLDEQLFFHARIGARMLLPLTMPIEAMHAYLRADRLIGLALNHIVEDFEK